jgi:hypothetical protein
MQLNALEVGGTTWFIHSPINDCDIPLQEAVHFQQLTSSCLSLIVSCFSSLLVLTASTENVRSCFRATHLLDRKASKQGTSGQNGLYMHHCSLLLLLPFNTRTHPPHTHTNTHTQHHTKSTRPLLSTTKGRPDGWMESVSTLSSSR